MTPKSKITASDNLSGEEIVPVDATSQNSRICTHNGIHKLAELGIIPQLQLLVRHRRTVLMLPPAKEVIRAHDTKEQQHEHLQNHTGNDGAVTVLLQRRLRVSGCGCDAATDGLDDEAGQVSREEDARVPFRLNARQARAEVECDVLESEVDGDADEGRGEDDGADLQLEGALVPGVRVEEDAADVACISSDTMFQKETDK